VQKGVSKEGSKTSFTWYRRLTKKRSPERQLDPLAQEDNEVEEINTATAEEQCIYQEQNIHEDEKKGVCERQPSEPRE